jgi:hypothetical protein
MPRTIVLLILAVALAGCSTFEPQPRIVDGWAIGDPLDCTARADCQTLAETARTELGNAEPDHAAVAGWGLYDETYYVDPATGDKILSTRSGSCCEVWLATLADGRTVAVGVGYPGVSKEPMAFRLGPAPEILGR